MPTLHTHYDIMEKGLLGSGVRIVYYNSLSGENTHL